MDDRLVSGTALPAPLPPWTHLTRLALEFTSDPGVETEVERTAQQPVIGLAPSHCHLFTSLSSELLPPKTEARRYFIWARTLQYPVEVTPVTSQQTGLLNCGGDFWPFWAQSPDLALVPISDLPLLMRDLRSVGPQEVHFPYALKLPHSCEKALVKRERVKLSWASWGLLPILSGALPPRKHTIPTPNLPRAPRLLQAAS